MHGIGCPSMGAGWPKPALVEPFTAFQAWDHGKASETSMVVDYGSSIAGASGLTH